MISLNYTSRYTLSGTTVTETLFEEDGCNGTSIGTNTYTLDTCYKDGLNAGDSFEFQTTGSAGALFVGVFQAIVVVSAFLIAL